MTEANIVEEGDIAVITSPNAGPSKLPTKGIIAVDMDDVLWSVLLFGQRSI